MKILFSSYTFRPAVGGIETVSEILAEAFVSAGHEVRLITETDGSDNNGASYHITRRPGLAQTLRLLSWCEVMFQNNISLRSLIPALALGKPVTIFHQTWTRNLHGGIGWNDRLKRMLLPLATNIAISRALAEDLSVPCRVVPNPYRDECFRLLPNQSEKRTLVFLGRLVSDKGVDLLLEALRLLRNEKLTPDLTIIGDGPEAERLQAQVIRLELQDQVTFAGKQAGAELVKSLNQFRVMVIPSRWAEPFGVVALEGIACGCAVVGSEQGGLKEAIGPCGVTFENGNAIALAHALKQLLTDKSLEVSLTAAREAHLRKFRAREVAAVLLQIIEETRR